MLYTLYSIQYILYILYRWKGGRKGSRVLYMYDPYIIWQMVNSNMIYRLDNIDFMFISQF